MASANNFKNFRIFKKDWQRASKQGDSPKFHFRINSKIGSSLKVNSLNWSRKMSWRCTVGHRYPL